jgi:hypothetical protein
MVRCCRFKKALDVNENKNHNNSYIVAAFG